MVLSETLAEMGNTLFGSCCRRLLVFERYFEVVYVDLNNIIVHIDLAQWFCDVDKAAAGSDTDGNLLVSQGGIFLFSSGRACSPSQSSLKMSSHIMDFHNVSYTSRLVNIWIYISLVQNQA